MLEGRERVAWNHTSNILWMLEAVHAAGKVTSTPATYNPTIKRVDHVANMDPEYVAAFEREMRSIEGQKVVRQIQRQQEGRT